MNVVGYAFEEAWASVRRAGRSAAVSIGTIAIAFLTLGGFMLVSVNVQRVLDRWLESAEVPVYLYDDLSDELRSELATYVRQQPAVAAVEFVSKQKALERFRADFPELLDVTNAVGQNPFPAALEIRLRSDATGTAAVDELTTGLAGRDGVADVRYDRRWLTRLAGIVTTAQVAAGVVAAVLMLGAAFTVAAVVRLANLWLNGRLADQRRVTVGSDLSCEAYRRTLVQPYGVHVQRNSTPTEQEADWRGFPLSRPVHQPGGGVVPLIPCSA